MRRLMFLLLTVGWLGLSSQPFLSASDPKQVAADEQRLKAVGIKTDDGDLLAFLSSRTLTDGERVKVEALVAQLGATAFRTREKASADLVAKGPLALEPLRQGVNDADLEISRRSELCLQKIKDRDVPADVAGAVVRLLAARKVPGAVAVLIAYVPFADSEKIADEVRGALVKLAMQDGNADKALVAALSDKSPVRRSAAAEALVRAGDMEHKKAVQALLHDPDGTVRWRVALALVHAKDKTAVPSLIDMLVGTPQEQAWQVEEILHTLAEKKSPPAVGLGVDDASRKKCRDVWLAWWKEHGKDVDLAVLQQKRLLGYTTIILLDMNRILELDDKNVVRWQIDNLLFPLDVQVLPNNRLLVAEYKGNRVTERNFKGEILWQYYFEGPQMAQRLANGNTFIAGKQKIEEVNPAGKLVLKLSFPPGEGIMKCTKLPNGEITCFFEDGKVARLDATGKELSSFRVDVNLPLFGGRIQVLANGDVLIPHHVEGKVVQYDATGKVVWQVRVDEPIVALRLPNDNTLVTSMNQPHAVEFDAAGNEVWEYRSTTRVTRAIRR
jgi:HEAT repeat protein